MDVMESLEKEFLELYDDWRSSGSPQDAAVVEKLKQLGFELWPHASLETRSACMHLIGSTRDALNADLFLLDALTEEEEPVAHQAIIWVSVLVGEGLITTERTKYALQVYSMRYPSQAYVAEVCLSNLNTWMTFPD